MTVWLIFGAMTLAALAALLWPLLRGRPPATGRLAHDLTVYKAQLAELDAEAERGAIGPDEAASARAEIERRMLRAAEAAPTERSSGRGWSLAAAVAIALLLPAAAAGVYHRLGAPNAPAGARAPSAAEEGGGELGTMTERLAARLKSQPDDLQGWMLLGRSYLQMGRYGDAVAAYTRAMNLAPQDADVQVAFAEALVFAADGIVTPPARSAFVQALTLDPRQAGARYYVGLADVQTGKKQQGYETWLSLARDTPEDAPWAALIKRQLTQLAAELGRDIEKDLPKQLADATAPNAEGPRGPTQEDMKAAAEMNPEDRAAFIRSMVEGLAARLEAKPDDPEGWLRLARAYGVLGEKQKQREALARAAKQRPNDPEVLQQAARAIVQAEMEPGTGPPAEALALYRKLLVLDPDHGEALWFTGLGAAYAGDRKSAAAAFERLLTRMDPKTPEYDQVKAQLDKVKSGGG